MPLCTPKMKTQQYQEYHFDIQLLDYQDQKSPNIAVD